MKGKLKKDNLVTRCNNSLINYSAFFLKMPFIKPKITVRNCFEYATVEATPAIIN